MGPQIVLKGLVRKLLDADFELAFLVSLLSLDFLALDLQRISGRFSGRLDWLFFFLFRGLLGLFNLLGRLLDVLGSLSVGLDVLFFLFIRVRDLNFLSGLLLQILASLSDGSLDWLLDFFLRLLLFFRRRHLLGSLLLSRLLVNDLGSLLFSGLLFLFRFIRVLL